MLWTHFSKVIKQPFRRGANLNRFLKKEMPLLLRCNIFLFSTRFRGLMHKKPNSFVYIFVTNFQFFHNNSARVCPIKLKIGVLYYKNDAFPNTDFYLSADVPLKEKFTKENNIYRRKTWQTYILEEFTCIFLPLKIKVFL